jgi:sugar/nucleoside kinase (ribokinase family)
MLDIRVDADALKRGGDVHGRVLLQPGGTSANAAVWAAWDGASARVHGRVGDDLPGRMLRAALAERGVEDALVVDPDAPSGTMLVVHEPGERSMVADRGANARLISADLPATLEARAVLVSGYLLLQPDGHDAAMAALERASAEHVAVDAASWPLVESFGVDRFFRDTRAADTLLANEVEARTLTGRDGPEAASALGERFRVVAVKRGAEGAILSVAGTTFDAPAEAISEVDPTGAGDAFDGVLLAALARGAEPADALERACHAGALVAASPGTWPEVRVR